MNNTAVASPAYAVMGVKPIILNLTNIIWVGHKNQDASLTFEQKTREATTNFGADEEETTTKEDWRKIIVSPPCSNPDEPFPETDSNGNPCRIMDHDPKTNTWTQCGTYAYVTYPDGQQRILPTRARYDDHIDSKMCHFALAAIAAWPTGEARNFPDRWRDYNNGGNINAASSITPVMWERATIQGYLKPNDLECLRSSTKRIRTDKPVNANIKRSRKRKSSAWPFSEKEHWFHVMSGALQITHNNMTQTLCNTGTTSRTNRERDLIKKSFPVFATKSEFKRARKFLENLSIKKNEQANRTDPGTAAGMEWDPLKAAFSENGGGLHTTMQSNSNLFSTPYTLVKTSLMLGCVPNVNEDGSITDYKQITSDYISKLHDTQPMTKSVTGTWKGGSGWSSRKPTYSVDVCNSVNVNNLTHMYMLLLNEVRLLSNDALVRWTAHQNLTMHKIDFGSNFLQNCDYDIFGYKLTDTLDYTCIVWSADNDDENEQ